jgi:hypothetical protein
MALVHFEKELKVCELIGSANGIATANGNIASAKSKYEGGRNQSTKVVGIMKRYVRLPERHTNCISPNMAKGMN